MLATFIILPQYFIFQDNHLHVIRSLLAIKRPTTNFTIIWYISSKAIVIEQKKNHHSIKISGYIIVEKSFGHFLKKLFIEDVYF